MATQVLHEVLFEWQVDVVQTNSTAHLRLPSRPHPEPMTVIVTGTFDEVCSIQ